ncbi:uncharacterized protein LOC6557324 [Drosophila grimshawi]|uniref:GH16322 n=1 Tax=Drosophila grimshawi TaxID=7222 RepID=B4IYB1_DROGR|nr:uncharacterized protein LOC6557324 [Drosophila grimshawi]EDV96561.1 GH16322 [Drosophila grimshawi]
MQLNSALMLLMRVLPLLLLFSPALEAAALPLDAEEIGYLELKPNGTLIFQQAPNQSESNLQNLLLLRSVLQALKLQPGDEHSKLNIKLYGNGVEHKFPPFLENIIQRIQTYFSVYRYTDTSLPVRKVEATTQPPQTLDVSTKKAKNPKPITVPNQQTNWIIVGDV